MKRVLFILFAAVLTQAVVAQPQQRRNQQAQQQQQQAQKSNANTMTTRAQISFPTQATMSEDVVWRRDIYRELDLTQDANAGLYYPVEPMGSQMNLFTYMEPRMEVSQLISTISMAMRCSTTPHG